MFKLCMLVLVLAPVAISSASVRSVSFWNTPQGQPWRTGYRMVRGGGYYDRDFDRRFGRDFDRNSISLDRGYDRGYDRDYDRGFNRININNNPGIALAYPVRRSRVMGRMPDGEYQTRHGTITRDGGDVSFDRY